MKRNETQLNATLFISVAINNECIRLEKMKLSAVSHICGQIDWFSEWKKLLAILNYDAIFCDISRNARIMWIKLFANRIISGPHGETGKLYVDISREWKRLIAQFLWQKYIFGRGIVRISRILIRDIERNQTKKRTLTEHTHTHESSSDQFRKNVIGYNGAWLYAVVNTSMHECQTIAITIESEWVQ